MTGDTYTDDQVIWTLVKVLTIDPSQISRPLSSPLDPMQLPPGIALTVQYYPPAHSHL